MNKFTRIMTAALLGSAMSGTIAAAEGDYYQGASRTASDLNHRVTGAISTKTYGYSTGGVSAHSNGTTINSGDFYEGANRPL